MPVGVPNFHLAPTHTPQQSHLRQCCALTVPPYRLLNPLAPRQQQMIAVGGSLGGAAQRETLPQQWFGASPCGFTRTYAGGETDRHDDDQRRRP
jgi:hypothetical protein